MCWKLCVGEVISKMNVNNYVGLRITYKTLKYAFLGMAFYAVNEERDFLTYISLGYATVLDLAEGILTDNSVKRLSGWINQNRLTLDKIVMDEKADSKD